MITEEKTFSPQESLQLITDAITRTKDKMKEHSFPFLLWGWLIAIASFSFYALHQYTSIQYYFLPFPILAVTGVFITFVYYRKSISTSTLSYLGIFLYKMWSVLALSFVVVIFINVSQSRPPFTYTLIIAAIGTLASGLIMKFNPLIIGGIIFFSAAIASIYIADDYKVLLHGVAIIFGYLVPGYLLKSSHK